MEDVGVYLNTFCVFVFKVLGIEVSSSGGCWCISKYVLCLFVSVGTEMSQYESTSPH